MELFQHKFRSVLRRRQASTPSTTSTTITSYNVHIKLGFVEVGRLKQVGLKFNRWLDVIYMELLLKDKVG